MDIVRPLSSATRGNALGRGWERRGGAEDEEEEAEEQHVGAQLHGHQRAHRMLKRDGRTEEGRQHCVHAMYRLSCTGVRDAGREDREDCPPPGCTIRTRWLRMGRWEGG
eukprot:9472153-Pyramimonas_sp.AAC.1